MWRWNRVRAPESPAVEEADDMTAQKYSTVMWKTLHGEYRRFARMIVNKANPPRGASVMEIGAGPGWVSVCLAQLRPDLRITVADLSGDMLRIAAENFAAHSVTGEFVQGEVEQLPEAMLGRFDLVYSRDSLHHWSDPVEGFRQLRSVLKPGGMLLVGDGRRDLSLAGRLVVAVISRTIGDMGKYWRTSLAAAYTPDELNTMMRNSGLSGMKVISGLVDLVGTGRS
jgi:ubiquinone/menaquinone biosynthesis C-methylase UbiE